MTELDLNPLYSLTDPVTMLKYLTFSQYEFSVLKMGILSISLCIWEDNRDDACKEIIHVKQRSWHTAGAHYMQTYLGHTSF